MDKDWIENLANAHFVSGQWHHERDLTPEKQVRYRRSLEELAKDLDLARSHYNEHHPSNRKIGFFKTTDELKGQTNSLMLLRGKSQVLLEEQNNILVFKSITFKGFQQRKTILGEFQIAFDDFGCLMWKRKDGMLLHRDHIIGLLMESIVRLSDD